MLVSLTLLLACVDRSPTGSSDDSGLVADSGENQGRIDLVDAELWEPLDVEEDPFSDHRQEESDCDPTGLFVENGLYEVDTSLCGYISAAQPMQTDVQLGDVLQVLVYHSSLSAEVPAEAHVAIQLGEHLIWEQRIAIPSGSGVYSSEVGAAFEVAAGTTAVFHLHNHGNNSWNLGHLRRER